MKKIIVLVIGVVLLAGAGVLFFSHRGGKIAIENVLPAKPVFYIRATDVSRRVESFESTKLFQELKSIDFKKIASRFGLPPEGVTEAEQRLNQVFSAENIRLMKILFGREIAVAVYTDETLKNSQPKNPAEVKKILEQLLGNIFIVTRAASDATAAETVFKFVGGFSKDFKTSMARYNGHTVNSVTDKDGAVVLVYVRIKDVFVLGTNDKAAKSAIDVFEKKQKALSSDEDFVARAKSLPAAADTVGFFDIRPIYTLLNAQIAEMDKSPAGQMYSQQFSDQLKQIQGLNVLTFANTTSDVLTGKAFLYFDKTKLDRAAGIYYRCAPDDNHSAKFVPWDALFYEWSTCLDFPLMWTQYKEQLTLQANASGRPLDVGKMVSGYEQMLGLSIDGDILPALGKEFGIYLTDVDTTGNFPIPKLVAFVQTTSRDKMNGVLNKLLGLQPNLQPQEEKYNGELIRYISIPFAESFKVSYTFVDNYLLLATNVDILKASLDAVKSPDKSIAVNRAFQANDGKKNSVFFVQIDSLLAKANGIFDWAGNMTKESQDQRQAFITGSQKNLDDLKVRNEALNAQVQQKKGQVAQLEASTAADPTVDVAAAKEALQKEIEALQKEIAANKERVQNISAQIKAYEDKAPKDDENRTVVEEFVKPLLKALANIHYISTVTVNGDGHLEATTQLKIE